MNVSMQKSSISSLNRKTICNLPKVLKTKMIVSKPHGQINLGIQRVLVTGGTGFIGAHIVEALVRRKTQVVCTYTAQNPQSYFFQKKLDRSVILVKVDVRDFSQIYHLVTRFKIDYILHLA